jgi:hypothetical protein
MASWKLELNHPPQEKRAFELWLQHAAGLILFEDVRGYAMERIDPNLTVEAQAAARKGIDDAVYGLMMVIDGVSGGLGNDEQTVELSVSVRLLSNGSEKTDAEMNLRNGDGMCMGYHGWLENDYGVHQVATPRPSTVARDA